MMLHISNRAGGALRYLDRFIGFVHSPAGAYFCQFVNLYLHLCQIWLFISKFLEKLLDACIILVDESRGKRTVRNQGKFINDISHK